MKKFSDMLKEAMESDNVEKEMEHLMDMFDDVYAKMIMTVGDNGMNRKNWHFTPQMLKTATKKMINEDGTKGAHWTIEETNRLMKENNIPSNEKFNPYDFNYVMNMLYSDYSQLLGGDSSNYVKMAKFFINDKDAPEGKALRYYIAMNPDMQYDDGIYFDEDYDYDYDDAYSRGTRMNRGRGRGMRNRGRMPNYPMMRRYDNGYDMDMEDEYDDGHEYEERRYKPYEDDYDYDDRYERNMPRMNRMRKRY